MKANAQNNLSSSNSIFITETLQESQISMNCDININKIGKQKNFIEAMKFVNSNKFKKNKIPKTILNEKNINHFHNTNRISSNNMNTTEDNLNVSEYSRINAHIFREEEQVNSTYNLA